MKTAVAIRHVHFEHLGCFEDVLKQDGYDLRYLDAGIDPLDDLDAAAPDLLVLLGGPIGVNDMADYPFLRHELRIAEARLAAGTPLLGICLGAQIIARAAGAAVRPGGGMHIGWDPISLTPEGEASPLGLLGAEPVVLHWHGDRCDLPAGARRLAFTADTANQAFSLGPNCLALQFHLEAKPDEMERWLIGHCVEVAATPGVTADELRAGAKRYGPDLTVRAGAVLRRWLEGR